MKNAGRYVLGLFLFAGMLVMPMSSRAATGSQACGADTVISENFPNANYGSATTMGVSGQIGNRTDCLLYFDVSWIPPGSTINSVALEMYCYNINGTPGDMLLCSIDSSWSEGSATWNDFPSAGAYQCSKTFSSTGWQYWDTALDSNLAQLRDLVQAWANGTKANNGLQLVRTINTGVSYAFYTSENSSSWPILFVDYTPPQPGTLQLSASSYSVGEGGGTVTIYVTRSGGSYGAASVNYATANGSATAGSDYSTSSGSLNWSDGDSATKSFTVSITDDSSIESDEGFTVSLSSASGASMGSPSSATVTITDNDQPSLNADLAISNLQFSPSTIYAGAHPAAVSLHAHNNGPAGLSGRWIMQEFYLSRNSTYGDGDDIYIGGDGWIWTLASGGDMDINVSSSGLLSLTIPSDASGDYYVFVNVRHRNDGPDPSPLSDPDTSNNHAMRAGAITVAGGIWSGATDLGGGWKRLNWFGDFYDSGIGWIYHNRHGWMYCVGSSASSIWFWTSDMGWLWSSQGVYSNLYRYETGNWLWYLNNSSSPRWFYNYSTASWESH